MALCLGEIGLSPAAFWRTTPIEVAAMLRGRRRHLDPAHLAPPSRAEFDRLRAAFPDVPIPPPSGAPT